MALEVAGSIPVTYPVKEGDMCDCWDAIIAGREQVLGFLRHLEKEFSGLVALQVGNAGTGLVDLEPNETRVTVVSGKLFQQASITDDEWEGNTEDLAAEIIKMFKAQREGD